MTKRLLIDALHPEETRVLIADDNLIEEYDFITAAKAQIKGNIYLAKVTRVEPSLQAAFVEYGGGKQGFLSFSEINPDYYQIPIADRKKLLEEAAAAREEEKARREREIAAQKAREEDRAARRSEQGEQHAGENNDSENSEEEAEVIKTNLLGGDEEEEASALPSGDANGDTEASETGEGFEGETESDEQHADGEQGEQGEGEGDGDQRRGNRRGRRGRRGPRRRRTFASEARNGGSSTSSEVENLDENGEHRPSFKALDEEEDVEDQKDMILQTFRRRYKIQEVIKRGQILLVQVIKDERGNKGASLTTYISLAGRYCVLMPNSSKEGGISRKIGRGEDRKRLKQIAAELRESQGMSVIIRTAGIDRTKMEIKRDYEYLIKLWNTIRDDALSSTAPALIYVESDIIKRSLRDYYSPDIKEILVQGDEAFKSAKEFMKMIMPSHAARVKQYAEPVPLFSEYNFDAQLQTMYQPVVKLRSGGYIVINHTEALIAIDVNSGRSTTERNVEETALKTNLEAAAEIARQLRLRDLGGLIVIDFIDMFYGKNRRSVERAFRDALKSDRAKIQASHISSLGLLELSRQRLRPSISETSTSACPHCQGTGFVRSYESLSIEIVRMLEKEASTGDFRELRLMVNTDLAVHLLNHGRKYLSTVEEQFNVNIVVQTDARRMPTDYSLEKIRRPQSQAAERGEEEGSRQEGGRRERGERGGRGRDRGRGRRGGRGRDRDDTPEDVEEKDIEETAQPVADTEADEAEPIAAESEQTEDGEESAPRKRTRGARGGRGRSRGGRSNARGAGEGDAEAPAPAETATEEAAERPATPTRGRRSSKADGVKTDGVKTDGVKSDGAAKPAGKADGADIQLITAKEFEEGKPEKSSGPRYRSSAPIVETTVEETDPARPKRGGWWRKMVE